MALAQSLTAVIVFWAVIGGIGASLLLPAMQSLIHGNFDGAARTQVYALVGAAAAIAAAVGPLLGGFITTFLSWRVGFAPRGRHHHRGALAASGSSRTSLIRARAASTWSGRALSVWAWVASCWASWSGRRVARR